MAMHFLTIYVYSVLLAIASPGYGRWITSHNHQNTKNGSSRFSWKTAESLITFGDSYTYVQGSPFGRTNYSFIGDRQHLSFTPEQLLGTSISQNNFTSTSAGGPNWAEYLTGCGLGDALTRPRDCKLQLWDFAFAGADISDDFLPPHHNFTVSFEQEIAQFVNYGDPVLSSFLDKNRALIASWIGINDINDGASLNKSSREFYAQLQEKHFSLIDKVYQQGYKNFLFFTLPPLERRPGSVNNPNPATNKTMVMWYNAALSVAASAFQTSHTDAQVKIFDVNKLLNGILDDPDQWGFKNVTAICPGYNQPDVQTDPGKYGCLKQEEYFWFDSGHIMWRVHEILAKKLDEWLGEEFS